MTSETKPRTLKDFQGIVQVSTAALQKLAENSPESLESLFKKYGVEEDFQTLILAELSVEVVENSKLQDEISNLKVELAKAIDAKKQLEAENICLKERGSKAGGAKVSKAGGSKAGGSKAGGSKAGGSKTGGSKPSSDEEILQGLDELADELETGAEMLLSEVGLSLIDKGIKGVKGRLKNLIDNSRFEIVNDGVRGGEMVKCLQ
jgi:hypothetical protein